MNARHIELKMIATLSNHSKQQQDMSEHGICCSLYLYCARYIILFCRVCHRVEAHQPLVSTIVGILLVPL